jgi:non-specific serine/threonine protein kinase
MQVLVHGQPLPRLRSRQSLWLLALLTLRHPRPVEREWLAGTLWPDSDQSRCFRNLRVVLSELRSALGPEGRRLRSPNRHTLTLDLTGATADVCAFDAAIVDGSGPALEQAVKLYRGRLLEGCNEEWVGQERAVREQDCLQALLRLADSALIARDVGLAIRYYQKAAGIDPWLDAARRGWMEALAWSGDTNAALQVYREFVEVLRSDPSAVPDEHTSALYQRLRNGARQRAKTQAVVVNDAAVPAIAGYLPHSLTELVGREDERIEVAARLRRSRLVTLTGLGGIGKTRLALEVAREVVHDYADGVWLIGLEALTEGNLVVPQIASVLGLREEPGRPLLHSLIDHLSKKRLLLVLDNCEHLLDACVRITEQLLRECGLVRVLATSREALGITGETAWAVPSLAIPDPTHLPESEASLLRVLLSYESVQLFSERAHAARKDFALTSANAPTVARVCCQLEGIPLAIELAAARVKGMTIEQIAARLQQHLGLLSGGNRALPSRQQTLRATLDWSHALLTEQERILLRRLSVFAGGWTLEAAERLCADEGEARTEWIDSVQNPNAHTQGASVSEIRHEDVLDLLTSLVEKSLVAFEVREGDACGRYRLLEMVRQYAGENLKASSEPPQVKARHRDWFLALAEEAEPHLQGEDQAIWLARLASEHDNLRAALAWSLEAEDGADAGLRLTGALWRFWKVRGHYSEGRASLSLALGRPRASGRTKGRGNALNSAGVLASYQGDYEAAGALHEESLAIFRESGDKAGLAWTLHHLALMASRHGDYTAAKTAYAESLAIFRELGDKQGLAWTLHQLGSVSGSEGDYGTASALHGESLAIQRELGNPVGIARSLNRLGRVAHALGNASSARDLYEEGLRIHGELGDRRGVAESLEGLAAVILSESEVQISARLLGAAHALRETIGSPLPPNEQETYDQRVAQACAVVGRDTFAAAWEAGQSLSWEQAVVTALKDSE